VKACPGKDAADVESKDGVVGTNTYATRTMIKYCLPKDIEAVKDIWENMILELEGSTFGGWLFDIYKASAPIMISLVTALAYCLLFIGLMSLFAEPLCWLVVILTELGLIGLAVMFFVKYLNVTSEASSTGVATSTSESMSAQAKGFLAASIGAICVWLLFSLFICCFFKSLKLAIDVVDASADFVMCTKRILLVPFTYFLISFILMIVWFFGYMGVMSMNPISASSIVPQGKTVDWSSATRGYLFVMWFGLLWMLIILNYCKNFVVLYASSSYYFNSPVVEVDENGETVTKDG